MESVRLTVQYCTVLDCTVQALRNDWLNGQGENISLINERFCTVGTLQSWEGSKQANKEKAMGDGWLKIYSGSTFHGNVRKNVSDRSVQRSLWRVDVTRSLAATLGRKRLFFTCFLAHAVA